jgi:hypothetical protein
MRSKQLIILVLLFVFVPYIHSQNQIIVGAPYQREAIEEPHAIDSTRLGIHGNLLSWITLAPHAEIDFYQKHHWKYSLGGAYGWWGFTGVQYALQTWKVAASARYYLQNGTFLGHSFGLRAEAGQIDARFLTTGKRGKLDIIGFTYAHTWRLGNFSHWYFDVEFGVGYVYADYVKYIPYLPTKCYHMVYHKYRNLFGLTNVGLNFSYRFPAKNKKH